MEPDNPSSSSLRWQILRHALRHHLSSNSENLREKTSLIHVSRRARSGFNLIPYHVVTEVDEKISEPKRDIILCYKLPLPDSPKLFLRHRVEEYVDLRDFDICNRYNIDNTGLVCQWPSEEILAFYCMSHPCTFRNKRVLELGSGYGLAGLVIAMVTKASEVVISDGNPQVVDYHNILLNAASFGCANAKSMLLHWDQLESSEISDSFDVIIASDCTFFKEFHRGLARTIRCFLKEDGSSQAILFSPKRGDSLNKFLLEVEVIGLNFTVTETYDGEIWSRHEKLLNGNDAWPNYEADHCYPVMVCITR